MPAEVVLRALKQAWTVLESLDLPCAVMGGVALAAWKHVRATRDVDLLVGVGSLNSDMLPQKLAEAGIRPKREPAFVNLGRLRLLQLLYQPPGAFLDIQIDLLLAECSYHLQALDRRVPIRLPELDLEVFVLACEDLILHKLLAGRILDRVDVVALLQNNRGGLDMEYLARWVKQLGLSALFVELWQDAFPGEPCSVS